MIPLNNNYNSLAEQELRKWQKEMLGRPGFINRIARNLQGRINRIIPEKVHQAITATIREMIRAVLFGAGLTTKSPLIDADLLTRETQAKDKIRIYRTTAAAEGGITGAGGLLAGLADFPLLLGIKLKLLFELAALYGFDAKDYRERVYLLYIFQLAFSSHHHRREIYLKMVDWEKQAASLPDDISKFDWRILQQEYRDYIDIAKMAQLIPVIGAPVGIVVNYRLIRKLGDTAMNAYRMRLIS